MTECTQRLVYTTACKQRLDYVIVVMAQYMAVIHCRSSRDSPFAISGSLDLSSCVCVHADTESPCACDERTRQEGLG